MDNGSSMIPDVYGIDVSPVDAIGKFMRHLHESYDRLNCEALSLEERASHLRKSAAIAKARILQMEEAINTLTAPPPGEAGVPLSNGRVIPVSAS